MANSKKRGEDFLWVCLIGANTSSPKRLERISSATTGGHTARRQKRAAMSDARAGDPPPPGRQPDVIVVDASMPEVDAVETTARIRGEHPAAKIVVVTSHDEGHHLSSLIAAGACGYVRSRAAVNDLLRVITTASRPGSAVETTSGTAAKGAKIGCRSGEITAREAEVLRLIAWGQSNKEIAGRLRVSVKTVEYHKARSTAKLGLRSRADILRYALSQNWLQNGENSR